MVFNIFINIALTNVLSFLNITISVKASKPPYSKSSHFFNGKFKNTGSLNHNVLSTMISQKLSNFTKVMSIKMDVEVYVLSKIFIDLFLG